MLRAASVVIAALAFKALFIFSYHSTDFEVHRNWLAVTHSLPTEKWYFESTSKWTLDYPPLFAWFEWLLSQVAIFVDRRICEISASPYVSTKAVIFQRCSVLCTEFLLIFSLWRLYIVLSKDGSHLLKRRFNMIISMFAFNFGLLIIDHIHFQYNGFLFGVFFLASSFLVEERYLAAALCFTALLYLKHIFLYLAPVYFVFILFNYCLASTKLNLLGIITRFGKVASIVALVTIFTFLPFHTTDQLRQIYSRLFPFDRGLTHAYWAPNFWAIYNTAERILYTIGRHYGTGSDLHANVSSMTRGLVGAVDHVILPSVRPLHCIAFCICGMVPHLVRCAWKSAAFRSTTAEYRFVIFMETTVAAAWSCFVFGWHVHEKAILMVVLPLNLLAVAAPKYSEIAFYVTTLGHFSLIPLIPTPAETPAIVSSYLAYTGAHWLFLFRIVHPKSKTPPARVTNKLVHALARAHLYGLPLVYTLGFVVWPLSTWSARFPFAPLMLVSVYTAAGIVLCFYQYLLLSMRPTTVYGTPIKSTEAKGEVKITGKEKLKVT